MTDLRLRWPLFVDHFGDHYFDWDYETSGKSRKGIGIQRPWYRKPRPRRTGPIKVDMGSIMQLESQPSKLFEFVQAGMPIFPEKAIDWMREDTADRPANE